MLISDIPHFLAIYNELKYKYKKHNFRMKGLTVKSNGT